MPSKGAAGVDVTAVGGVAWVEVTHAVTHAVSLVFQETCTRLAGSSFACDDKLFVQTIMAWEE